MAEPAPVDRSIIDTAHPRLAPQLRRALEAPARSARATAVLFAFGSFLTLVDAFLTRALLTQETMTERWGPVRELMHLMGVDLALAICSVAAIGAMALVAWGSVRARPALASASFIVLCAVVAVRVFGCVNNFGLILR